MILFYRRPGRNQRRLHLQHRLKLFESPPQGLHCICHLCKAVKLLKHHWTANFEFKVLVPCGVEDKCYISVSSDQAQKLQDVSLIIWDETRMCHRHCINSLDLTLYYVMQNYLPFGGKVLLFSRNFRQILLLNLSGSKAQISIPVPSHLLFSRLPNSSTI